MKKWLLLLAIIVCFKDGSIEEFTGNKWYYRQSSNLGTTGVALFEIQDRTAKKISDVITGIVPVNEVKWIKKK